MGSLVEIQSGDESPHSRGSRRPLVRLVPAVTMVLCAGMRVVGAADGNEGSSAPQLERFTTDGHFKQRPAWSPDGKSLVFARHRGSDIFLHVLSIENQQERRLTDRDAPEYDAVFSPDGQRLAFALDKTSPNQGDIEVYTVGVDGQDLQPVAISQGKLSHEEWPAWSPDGKSLAFTSTRDGNQELYVSKPDGSEVRRLTSDPALDAHPCWSADGKQVAFATNRWGDLELAVIEVETGRLTRLTESRGLDDYPAYSPDGRRLAFTTNRGGNFEIYVLDLEQQTFTNATDHAGIDNFAAWSPDGRLTFVSNRAGGFDVYALRWP